MQLLFSYLLCERLSRSSVTTTCIRGKEKDPHRSFLLKHQNTNKDAIALVRDMAIINLKSSAHKSEPTYIDGILHIKRTRLPRDRCCIKLGACDGSNVIISR